MQTLLKATVCFCSEAFFLNIQVTVILWLQSEEFANLFFFPIPTPTPPTPKKYFYVQYCSFIFNKSLSEYFWVSLIYSNILLQIF